MMHSTHDLDEHKRKSSARRRPLFACGARAFVLSVGLLGLAPAYALGALSNGSLYVGALKIMEDRYLFPEKLQAGRMLAGSARHLTDELDWLMIKVEGENVTLRHGEGDTLGVVSAASLDELPSALTRVEGLIRQAAEPFPEDFVLDEEILRGAIATLDKPSTLLNGRRLERFDERLRGVYQGIGVRIEAHASGILLREVYEAGPAEGAGLRPEDIILAIDGVSTLGMQISDANERIRGESGTRVELLVQRAQEKLAISVQRGEVRIQNVQHRLLSSGVALVTITHFSEQTVEFLRKALTELNSQGALDRGIIIDLRGNTGGSMIQAARAADRFLVQGLLVRTEGRDDTPVDNLIRELVASDEGNEPDLPVMVLVDRRTASGSEIMAGALALLGRAVLVGERTFGKGTVQKIFNLRPGVRLKLTVAEYKLEGDVSVAQQGLDPDIIVSRAIFDANGVRFEQALEGESASEALHLLFAEEKPGWEKGFDESVPDRDVEIEVAERVLLRSRGSLREETLQAARETAATLGIEEDRHITEVFSRGGVDWRKAPVALGPTPPLNIEISTEERPTAGEPVTLCGRVANHGTEPVYRAALQLFSENRLWDRQVLPIGYLAPGTENEGCRILRIPATAASRADDVSVALQLDGHESPPPIRRLLTVEGRVPPSLSVRASLVPAGDHHQVRLHLQNGGREPLRALKVRLAFPEDSAIRLLDPEGFVPSLARGLEQRVDLDLSLGPAWKGESLDLGLIIESEGFGKLLDWDLSLPLDGRSVRHEAPSLRWRGALSAVAGQATPLDLKVTDDGPLESVVVWVNDEKVLFRRGGERRMDVSLSVRPVAGSNRIEAISRDTEGHVSRATAWVLGVPESVADEIEDP